MAKDALNVSKMNVNPGGKQSLMRSTVYGTNQVFQLMVFSSDHPIYPNQAKGMKQILIERGLYYEGLIGDCQLCKEKIDDITRTRVLQTICRIKSDSNSDSIRFRFDSDL